MSALRQTQPYTEPSVCPESRRSCSRVSRELFRPVRAWRQTGRSCEFVSPAFHRADAVEDRVAVGACERREEGGRCRIRCEGGGEVGRRLGDARGRIGALPASVRLGRRDLGVTRRQHAARDDEFDRSSPVDLRPFASQLSRREADQPVVPIVLVQLSIDPAVTKGGVDSLRFGEGRLRRSLLSELELQPRRIGFLSAKPSLERGGIGERKDWQVGARFVHFRNSIGCALWATIIVGALYISWPPRAFSSGLPSDQLATGT